MVSDIPLDRSGPQNLKKKIGWQPILSDLDARSHLRGNSRDIVSTGMAKRIHRSLTIASPTGNAVKHFFSGIGPRRNKTLGLLVDGDHQRLFYVAARHCGVAAPIRPMTALCGGLPESGSRTSPIQARKDSSQ